MFAEITRKVHHIKNAGGQRLGDSGHPRRVLAT